MLHGAASPATPPTAAAPVEAAAAAASAGRIALVIQSFTDVRPPRIGSREAIDRRGQELSSR